MPSSDPAPVQQAVKEARAQVAHDLIYIVDGWTAERHLDALIEAVRREQVPTVAMADFLRAAYALSLAEALWIEETNVLVYADLFTAVRRAHKALTESDHA